MKKKLDEIRKDERLVKLIRDGGKDKDFEEELKMIEHFVKKFKSTWYRRDKRNYMLSSNKSLLDYVSAMLLLLEPHFIKKHKSLIEKNTKAI